MKTYSRLIRNLFMIFVGLLIMVIGHSISARLVSAQDKEFIIKNNVLVEYSGNDELVILPAGITQIGQSAFADNQVMKEIFIPDSVTRIDFGAFKNCTKLESIDIPDSVVYMGNNVFDNCTALTSIRLSENISSIGDSAFTSCSSLEQIQIPEGVTLIGSYAFMNCTSLDNINIPNSVTEIYPDILKGTKFYDNFQGDFMEFNGILLEYRGEASVVTVPDNIRQISTYAFYNKNMVREFILPESITNLSMRIASHCEQLKSIKIPASVTSIGEELVYVCHKDFTIYGLHESVAEAYAKKNNIPFRGISINKSKVTLYINGSVNTENLTITGSRDQHLWISSNDKVAAVSDSGTITAVSEGSAVIYTEREGLIASCKVTVKEPYISCKTLTLEVGSSYNLTIKGITSGITWKSSDSSIIKVSDTGRITALRTGYADITAQVNGVKYTCKVTAKTNGEINPFQ